MKKQVILLLTVLLLTIHASAQNTFVPDDHFEQALIDLGVDMVLDDSVVTANIDTMTYLHISWADIDDLTGIEDFSSLVFLQVNSNNLTFLDVSQNTQLTNLHCALNNLSSLTLGNNLHLKHLNCGGNMLTNLSVSGLPALYTLIADNNLITQLNVSQNPLLNYLNIQNNLLWNLNTSSNSMLEGLVCTETPIMTLNLSQNPLLKTLNCLTTQLTELDLSQNPALLFLNCSNNSELERLNVKNGSNTTLLSIDATQNPELFCITVDTPSYSQTHWTNVDNWVSFQEDCTLGLGESAENAFDVYPNPAVNEIRFSAPLENLTIRDISGRTVISSRDSMGKANLSGFPAGVYILHGTSKNGKPVSIRFVLQDH